MGLIDLPGAGADLSWLAGVMWGDLPGIGVTLGPAPAGRVAVERYRIVPGRRAPRMLIPMDGKAVWAAARDGRATRSARASFERTLAGLVARAGAAGLAFRDVLTVHADPGAQAPTLPGVLEETLGEPVSLAINVRPPGPYRKPVVQVVGPGGRLLAYAKVSWNDLTEANVRAEAAALRLVAEGGAPVRAPRIRSEASWKGRLVLMTEPMPAGLRRYGTRRPAPDAGLVRGLASIGGIQEEALGEGVVRGLRGRLGACTELPDVAEAVAELLEALAASGDVRVAVGLWHGDWSPWNLGLEGERLWAWDWEYSRRGVPVGLDLPHFHFQSAFIGQRRDLASSFGHARARSEGALASIGLDARDRRSLLGVHAAEVALRYLEAAARGAEPNPRFLAEAVPVLRAAADRVSGG